MVWNRNEKITGWIPKLINSLNTANFPKCVLARRAKANCEESFDCLPVELLTYLTSIYLMRKVKTAILFLSGNPDKTKPLKERKQWLLKLRKTLPSGKWIVSIFEWLSGWKKKPKHTFWANWNWNWCMQLKNWKGKQTKENGKSIQSKSFKQKILFMAVGRNFNFGIM